jgi:hypothetical protein
VRTEIVNVVNGVNVVIRFLRVEITLRVEIALCVYKLHSACRNLIFYIKTTLSTIEVLKEVKNHIQGF